MSVSIVLGKTKIKKEFVQGIYTGVVREKNDRGLYLIQYEDGDSEEMTLNTLLSYMPEGRPKMGPGSRGPRGPYKKRGDKRSADKVRGLFAGSGPLAQQLVDTAYAKARRTLPYEAPATIPKVSLDDLLALGLDKLPQMPKKPKNPYQLFQDEYKAKKAGGQPEDEEEDKEDGGKKHSYTMMQQEIARVWNDMSNTEKQVYDERADAAKRSWREEVDAHTAEVNALLKEHPALYLCYVHEGLAPPSKPGAAAGPRKLHAEYGARYPRHAYGFYLQEVQQREKAAAGGGGGGEPREALAAHRDLRASANEDWAAMDAEAKAPYEAKAEADRAVCTRDLQEKVLARAYSEMEKVRKPGEETKGAGEEKKGGGEGEEEEEEGGEYTFLLKCRRAVFEGGTKRGRKPKPLRVHGNSKVMTEGVERLMAEKKAFWQYREEMKEKHEQEAGEKLDSAKPEYHLLMKKINQGWEELPEEERKEYDQRAEGNAEMHQKLARRLVTLGLRKDARARGLPVGGRLGRGGTKADRARAAGLRGLAGALPTEPAQAGLQPSLVDWDRLDSVEVRLKPVRGAFSFFVEALREKKKYKAMGAEQLLKEARPLFEALGEEEKNEYEALKEEDKRRLEEDLAATGLTKKEYNQHRAKFRRSKAEAKAAAAAPDAVKHPDLPLSTWLLFLQDFRQEFKKKYKKKNTDAQDTQALSAEASVKWRKLGDKEKAALVKRAEADKARYERECQEMGVEPHRRGKTKKVAKLENLALSGFQEFCRVELGLKGALAKSAWNLLKPEERRRWYRINYADARHLCYMLQAALTEMMRDLGGDQPTSGREAFKAEDPEAHDDEAWEALGEEEQKAWEGKVDPGLLRERAEAERDLKTTVRALRRVRTPKTPLVAYFLDEVHRGGYKKAKDLATAMQEAIAGYDALGEEERAAREGACRERFTAYALGVERARARADPRRGGGLSRLAPKRALSAFEHYVKEMNRKRKRDPEALPELVDLAKPQLAAALAERWAALAEELRQPYEEEAEADARRYRHQLQAYERTLADGDDSADELEEASDGEGGRRGRKRKGGGRRDDGSKRGRYLKSAKTALQFFVLDLKEELRAAGVKGAELRRQAQEEGPAKFEALAEATKAHYAAMEQRDRVRHARDRAEVERERATAAYYLDDDEDGEAGGGARLGLKIKDLDLKKSLLKRKLAAVREEAGGESELGAAKCEQLVEACLALSDPPRSAVDLFAASMVREQGLDRPAALEKARDMWATLPAVCKEPYEAESAREADNLEAEREEVAGLLEGTVDECLERVTVYRVKRRRGRPAAKWEVGGRQLGRPRGPPRERKRGRPSAPHEAASALSPSAAKKAKKTGFHFYFADHIDALRRRRPGAPTARLQKELQDEWRAMGEAERDPWALQAKRHNRDAIAAENARLDALADRAGVTVLDLSEPLRPKKTKPESQPVVFEV